MANTLKSYFDAYLITTTAEYDYCVKHGYEPLLFNKFFRLDINLRVEIQKRLFGHCTIGRGNIPQANERFYRWCWEHLPHRCEETLRPLTAYSACYVSHILARGAYPEMAHDPRNVNILSYAMHAEWENGKREEMRIYKANAEKIEILKSEYNAYTKAN